MQPTICMPLLCSNKLLFKSYHNMRSTETVISVPYNLGRRGRGEGGGAETH